MNLPQLTKTLPNGLHDAYLIGFDVSFTDATAVLRVRILVNSIDEETRHEDAEIYLEGLQALVIEGPQMISQPLATPLDISSFDTTEEYYPAFATFPEAIKINFLSLYLDDPWNSFIHLAAVSARIAWSAKHPSDLRM